MKKIFTLLVVLSACVPLLKAESFTAGGETYTYAVKDSSTPSAGVKYTRMRFTSPNACNVSLVEVDLTNPDVRVETFVGQDKMFKTESLTDLYKRKKNAGRIPVLAQNGHFWSMSSQTGTSAGVHATTTCLGGAMVNGHIITETNWAHDQWNGGPSRTGVLGFTTDGKAYIDNYQSSVKVMCPAKWGADESSNSLLITDVNKYCIASDFMAMFTPDFPSDKVMKVLDTSAGQPGSVVAGNATEVYLTMDAGQTLANNKWITAKVGKIVKNASSGGTRGEYDFVLVAAPGVSQNVMAGLAEGDQMKIKYNWHLVGNEANVPAFENVMAGNAIVMKNGSLTSRNTDESYNSSYYARSLYGVSADNKKLIMMVVGKGSNDSEGTSNGLTTAKCANIMKQFGADDVLQVDGGGSAQMMMGGTMVAKSSDSSGVRSVASGVVVYSNGTSVEPDEPEVPAEPDTYQEVTPASGNANPYATSLSGTYADGKLTVNYLLNASANAVSLVVKQGGAVINAYPLGSANATKGAHQGVVVDVDDLSSGTYTWSIQVSGEDKTTVHEVKSIRFNHPQGVDVDNNPESPYFGRVYVTEGRSTTNSVHYSYANGGQGLYMFSPTLDGIKNEATGKYVFGGGVTFYQKVGDKSGADFRKVRVSEDGRVFVTRQNDKGNYLYELPDVGVVQTQNAAFTQVFTGGAVNTSTSLYENGGTFISGPNVGFDVKGSGSNLKIAMLCGPNSLFASSAVGGTRVDEYNLGNNKTWSAAPSKNIAALSGKYTVNFSGTNLCYDDRGGLWYCQYRQSPSATLPSLVYVDANGDEKYKDIETIRGGGGIRLSPDYSKIAIASSESSFSIYAVSFNSDGEPVLDEELRVIHGMGKNVNDFAWDMADNIYTLSNNNEVMKVFSLPRENNVVVTDATSKYSFNVDPKVTYVSSLAAEEQEAEYYNLQGVKVENPSGGIFIKKQGKKVTKVVL